MISIKRNGETTMRVMFRFFSKLRIRLYQCYEESVKKHGDKRNNFGAWLHYAQEELGEVYKAINERENSERVIEELIQVITMLALCIEQLEYEKKGE